MYMLVTPVAEKRYACSMILEFLVKFRYGAEVFNDILLISLFIFCVIVNVMLNFLLWVCLVVRFSRCWFFLIFAGFYVARFLLLGCCIFMSAALLSGFSLLVVDFCNYIRVNAC